MNRRYIDLLLIDVLVLISSVLAVFNSPLLWIRGPLGVLVALVVPGYLLTEILFPRSSVTGFERVVLIAGLSASFVAVGGVLLYMAFGDLSVRTWVNFFILTTAAGIGIIILQRQQRERTAVPVDHTDLEVTQPLRRGEPRPLVGRWLPFALALAIVIGSIYYTQAIAQVYPGTEVIQMWMIPDQSNPAHAVQVGVVTQNAIPSTYTIQVKRGDTTIQVWTNVRLQSDERWQETVALPMPLPGTGPLVAQLVNPNSPAKLIRQVTLWPEAP